MENKLYYSSEAKIFEEALPIGNGRMGAMVYGGVGREKLSLNEDSAWSGTGKKNPAPENAYESLKKAQKLVLDDEIAQAQEELAENFFAMWSQIYLPVGNLYLDFEHKNASDYRRELDISTGICRTTYKAGGASYEREVFASHPDDVIAIKLSSDKAGSLNFTLSTETKLKLIENKFENGNYISTVRCPSNGCNYPFVQKEPFIYTEENGIGITTAVKVLCDGTTEECTDGVRVKNATSAVLYISIKTSFNGYDKNPGTEGLDNYKNALKVLEGLDFNGYETVKNKHVKDFSSLYNRVELNLNSTDNRDTYQRIKNFDGSDLGLYELLFGYGRYLTISSSRKGTQATNLQGIWNEKFPAPWSSNYTININTEMNYWPTLNTNLLECYEPFVALAEKLHINGQETARKYYNARGFVSHHNTDLWGMTNPVGYKRGAIAAVFAFWNMSSGWIASQLYDLYEYTMDKDKLEEIYPIIRDAVLFYTDILYKDEEGYMISPSTSPENVYLREKTDDNISFDMSDKKEFSADIKFDDKERLSVSKTTTMTMSILKELFVRYIKASEILGVENELTKKVSEILPDLYPVKITSDGRIMEWAYEEEEAEIGHRHVSHLYSLYPGNQITVEDTPELAEACKQSLLVRGDDGTGWSLGWKTNLWAYLKDGNHALTMLKRQLNLVEPTDEIDYAHRGGTYPNMFDAHPPFQIDGNFGSTAAICNMLMQSEIGHIELLPALPDDWKDGSVSGIVAKGNIEIDMEWKDKKVTSLTLKSADAKTVSVYVNGKREKIEIAGGKAYKIMF